MNKELKKENITPLEFPTKDRPICVNNYPYSFKKCNAKYWAETKGDKQRVMFQTQNPKNFKWNNPRKSTYSDIILFYTNNENNHIETASLNFMYDGDEELLLTLELFGKVLTDWQIKRLRTFKAIIKTRRHINYKIKEGEYTENDKNEEEKTKIELFKVFNKYLGENDDNC